MKKVELLAPAGDFSCLKAAIEAGCDAVYMGGKLFGARAFSSNFTDEEIKTVQDKILEYDTCVGNNEYKNYKNVCGSKRVVAYFFESRLRSRKSRFF